ncbi:site-specific integrase [uncultured Methylibium sp.]|uniref:tyrosine-type recombinase/integrase n=1 Tax=uncultured Methylibium sp. TaxID=381093 RepID=UPI0025E638F0|nr:site-specific integrase [uncultured Methylibium sp.]
MAGERGRLTDLQIRHWIKAGEPLAKADGGGLTFTLSAGGAAGWVLRYSHGGRRRELTIGRYPDIGLADARGIATIKRAEIMQGRNPAADKQKAKATAAKDWTVRELAKDYRAKKLVSLAHSTQVSYGRHLKRVEKKLGALTVREIEASDVVALIEGSGLTWGESNMLLITTKCLFTHACGKRLINVNPCHGIMLSALLGERPPKRQRLMLTRDEIQLLLAAELRRRNALAIRILLATAVRSAEIYQAKWVDVDLDGAQWHIPKSKTGAAMDIPLAPGVVDWFKELRTLAGESAYVLPAHSRSRAARHGGDTHLNKDTLREAIDHWLRTEEPAVRRFTPHDLRSTMKSHMRALGVPRDISEMCLNHKLSGVEGIYDRHTYFEERREALEKWAEFLERCDPKQRPM